MIYYIINRLQGCKKPFAPPHIFVVCAIGCWTDTPQIIAVCLDLLIDDSLDLFESSQNIQMTNDKVLNLTKKLEISVHLKFHSGEDIFWRRYVGEGRWAGERVLR